MFDRLFSDTWGAARSVRHRPFSYAIGQVVLGRLNAGAEDQQKECCFYSYDDWQH
jgi:hypothetical protein